MPTELNRNETIERYRQESIRADEHYYNMLKQHGHDSLQAKEALRKATDAHGQWAELAYDTQ